MSTLYLVATPIGNLEDITLRALKVLEEADAVACEDTRETLKLLNHYGIKNKLFACHKFNETAQAEKIAERVAAGETIALVSDAGLPLISDPGSPVVTACREKGVPVRVVPGASAGLSALMLSGMDTRRFTFFGFPEKSGSALRQFVADVAACPQTAVIYESPHHIVKMLEEMARQMPERRLSVSRELTKKFEETLSGTPAELLAHFKENAPRGEFVIVAEGAPPAPAFDADESVAAHVARLVAGGMSEKDAIKTAAKARGLPKRDVYRAVKIEEET